MMVNYHNCVGFFSPTYVQYLPTYIHSPESAVVDLHSPLDGDVGPVRQSDVALLPGQASGGRDD